jgi:hypothetical protein
MKQFTIGLILGSVLTGTLVSAGTFYDSKGKPNAPTGSVQQFDYFRQRQLFLDTAAQRRLAERPCAR